MVAGRTRGRSNAQQLDYGYWLRVATPNYHAQTGIFPSGANILIACAGTVVMPGDVITAADDRVVVVPAQLAPQLAEAATGHAE